MTVWVVYDDNMEADQSVTSQVCLGERDAVTVWMSADYVMEVGFGPKVGQDGPKWDKSETFSDQISVHFAKMY